MGQGNYWRVQTEDLLLGVRGEAKHFRRRDLRNVVRVERGQYSRKPDHVRTLIEQASYGPYLELFGREDVEGWTVFGNERISFLLGTTTQPRCAWCDNPFSPKRKRGKYCGDACRQRAHRAKIA